MSLFFESYLKINSALQKSSFFNVVKAILGFRYENNFRSAIYDKSRALWGQNWRKQVGFSSEQ